LDAEGVEGALVLWEPANGPPQCHGGARCTEGFLPASTYKIPNSLIALETGVVPDADFTLAWDGTKYWVEAWNQDHDLRSAIRVSALWYYQELARRIGVERMQSYVDRFDYGNRNLGGGIDRFWLFGELRITPLEQVRFLRKLQERSLPLSARTIDIVRDITTLAKGDGWVLRGKTGGAGADDYPEPGHLHTGWLVGWVERGDRVVLYAVLALGPPDKPMDWSVRPRLAEALLEGEGVLPADAEPWP
jgi:beta-lactamase class D